MPQIETLHYPGRESYSFIAPITPHEPSQFDTSPLFADELEGMNISVPPITSGSDSMDWTSLFMDRPPQVAWSEAASPPSLSIDRRLDTLYSETSPIIIGSQTPSSRLSPGSSFRMRPDGTPDQLFSYPEYPVLSRGLLSSPTASPRLLDRVVVDRGTVVPQTLWSPHSVTDGPGRQHVEQEALKMPIFFEGKDGRLGISLEAATAGQCHGLLNVQTHAPFGHMATTHIRIGVRVVALSVIGIVC